MREPIFLLYMNMVRVSTVKGNLHILPSWFPVRLYASPIITP